MRLNVTHMLAAGGAAMLLAAGPAAAVEDGVHIDPNSPAGTEYALPLDQARKDAGGSPKGEAQKSGDGTSAEAAPLFGEGISKRGQAKQSKPAAKSGAGSDTPAARGTAPTQLAAASDDGSSGTLTMLGIAGAVLLVGGGLGLVLRRGLRDPA